MFTKRLILRVFSALFILAVIFGQVIPVYAAGNWTSNGPEGGSISVLVIDPATPSTLYAGTHGYGGGVFKSTNSGGNWSAANTGLTNTDVHSLIIDSTMSAILYVGTSGGLFKSINGGGNWSAFNAGLTNLDVRALAINPATPNTLYAGTAGGGIFKSINGGGNWNAVNTGLTNMDIRSLAINPTTPTTIYVGTYGGGVFESTDSGGNWNAINSGLTDSSVLSLAIDPATPATLYAGTGNRAFKSTNGGASWSAMTGLPNTDVFALVINPLTTPATLYAGTNGAGVQKSTDGGGSWSGITSLINNNPYINALAIDPATPAILYAGTDGDGVLKSTNAGGNWNTINSGLINTYIYFLAMDPTTQSTLYAGTFIGLFKSTNSGESWSAVSTGLTNKTVVAMTIDPVTPSTLYVGTDGGGMFKSTNGGGNWSAINTGLTNHYAYTLAIDPTTPTTLYVGTAGGGVFKSTNSGGNWSTVNMGLTNTDVTSLAINSAALYVGTDGGVFKSTNSGGSWNTINTGLTSTSVSVLTIDPVTPTTLYAGIYGGGLFKSTNDGGNWSAVSTGLTSDTILTLAIDPTTPDTVFAGTNGGGIFKSMDGGANWNTANDGLINGYIPALAINAATPATLYAGTSGDGVVSIQVETPTATETPAPTVTKTETPTPTSTPTVTYTPTQQAPYTVYTAISAYWDQTCGLTNTGGVKCWGYNLGGYNYGQGSITPIDVSGLTSGVIAISTGMDHACALTSVGGVKCWGFGTEGQLGDGTNTSSVIPVDVSGLTSGVTAISSGNDHTCVVTSVGGVKCWGAGGYGQLGNGTNTSSTIPVDVSGLNNDIVAISAGDYSTCVLTNIGSVKCWGYNGYGQLGDGTKTSHNAPVDVYGLSTGITAISAGRGMETCALSSAGGVKCWGYYNNTARTTPVDINGLSTGVSSISTGYDHTCALTNAGDVKCWGWYYTNSGHFFSYFPTDVVGLAENGITISAIATGLGHSCALTSIGGIKCWGLNNQGQLGDGTTITNGWLPQYVIGSNSTIPTPTETQVPEPTLTTTQTQTLTTTPTHTLTPTWTAIPTAVDAVCYVNASASGGNNGSSWLNAYTNLQSALGTSACTEIWVAAGTYKPTDTTDRTISFVLKNGVALYGGFSGTETLLTQRNPITNVTVLSGDIGVSSDTTDNSYHVVIGSSTNATAIMDGFSIVAGNANGISPNDFGGGMYNSSGNPTLTNLIFSSNIAGAGGAVYNTAATHLTLTDITFNANIGHNAGALYNDYSNLTLNNVTFDSNVAGGNGGGMGNEHSTVYISNATFINNINNHAPGAGNGGGMLNNYSNVTIVNALFEGNTTNGSGGGIANFHGDLIISNTTFSNNSAINLGGGIENYDSSGEVTKVTLKGNSAAGGGGMHNVWSSPTLTNLTFSGNSASQGGGLFNDSSNPILKNVTFNSNSATSATGGGMYNFSGSHPEVNDVIFWGNSSEIYNYPDSPTSNTLIKDSIVQGGCSIDNICTNIINADPKLGSLADNGGFTQTLALLTGSAAIDTGGVNSTCADTDQRGVIRPQGNACDIGAFEYAIPTVTPTVTATPTNTVTLTPTLSVLYNPNNGHYYKYISTLLDWPSAEADAEASQLFGVSGHLATVTSFSEQQFLQSSFPMVNTPWLGSFQPAGSSEPDGNWQWVTDEPFIYTNWRSDEPNNASANSLGYEDSLQLNVDGTWNDGAHTKTFPYIIEYDTSSESGTSTLTPIPTLLVTDTFTPTATSTFDLNSTQTTTSTPELISTDTATATQTSQVTGTSTPTFTPYLTETSTTTPVATPTLSVLYNPNNGHYYEYISTLLDWTSAKVAAETSQFSGVTGHLATITSFSEQQFLQSSFPMVNTPWLGGFQPAGSSEPDGNWQWVTGEPFIYTNWRSDEPNNASANSLGYEDSLQFNVDSTWNDGAHTKTFPYIVEYDLVGGLPADTLTPTLTLSSTDVATNTPTSTLTLTPTVTATNMATLTPTETFTLTLTNTLTQTITPTWTKTSTFTNTPPNIATSTPTFTSTATFTVSPTATSTPTITLTRTKTATPSFTPTVTFTASKTLTRTPTRTPTKTLTIITIQSASSYDGWILELSENSKVGGSINSTATTFNLGDDAAKRQYRSILSFNTGVLPDIAVITGITLKVKQQAIIGGSNPVTMFQGFMLDMKNGFWGTSAVLQPLDFQVAASKTLGPVSPSLVDGSYNFNLINGKDSINKLVTNGGLTQIRLRFNLDDNNNAVANYLSLYSGNATAANRPQLIIQYYLP